MQETLKGSESESDMDKEKAIKILRNKIECLSHSKCSDCPLDKVCDQLRTPSDSEYIAAYGMAIEALSAEPCEDAISRAWLKEAIHNFYYGLKHTPTEEDIQAYIDVAPLVTPKQKMGRWIPVSERLPENSGNYLITYCYRDEIETQEAVYVKDEKEDKWFDITDIEITLAVIAWMPLPEPYLSENPTGSNSEEESEDTE